MRLDQSVVPAGGFDGETAPAFEEGGLCEFGCPGEMLLTILPGDECWPALLAAELELGDSR
jgi:hypothetical protein